MLVKPDSYDGASKSVALVPNQRDLSTFYHLEEEQNSTRVFLQNVLGWFDYLSFGRNLEFLLTRWSPQLYCFYCWGCCLPGREATALFLRSWSVSRGCECRVWEQSRNARFQIHSQAAVCTSDFGSWHLGWKYWFSEVGKDCQRCSWRTLQRIWFNSVELLQSYFDHGSLLEWGGVWDGELA